jgi:hypothetical protein
LLAFAPGCLQLLRGRDPSPGEGCGGGAALGAQWGVYRWFDGQRGAGGAGGGGGAVALLPRCSVVSEVRCWLCRFGEAALRVSVVADGEAWGEAEEASPEGVDGGESTGGGDAMGGNGGMGGGGGDEMIPWRAFSFPCEAVSIPLLAQLLPPPRAPSLHSFRAVWPRLGFALAVHGTLVGSSGGGAGGAGCVPTAAALLAELRSRCFCSGGGSAGQAGAPLSWGGALGGGAPSAGRGQRWAAWVPLRTGGSGAGGAQLQGRQQLCLQAAYVSEVAMRETGAAAAGATLAVTFTATMAAGAEGRWETRVEVSCLRPWLALRQSRLHLFFAETN